MRKLFYLKALMLSLFMSVSFALPLNAQNSDDFFQVDDGFNNNRVVTSWGIVNNGIGQSEAPIGSGILILSAAGAGYAIIRRKRKFNNGTMLLLTFVLLLGMTGCRKNIVAPTTTGVYITLSVDDGSKVIVNPTGGTTYATVVWENGDIIYVGNNQKYCGYLEYDGSNFSGTIDDSDLSTEDYLHFYFMGNKGTTSKPTSVCITDQTSRYPVISYGHSTSLYNSGTTEYSARLFNKCAIMKFTTTNISKVITITGMNNTVTVDFTANHGVTTGDPYTFSKSNNGRIRLHAETNTERWAILLPQDEVNTVTAYAEGYTTSGVFTVPALSANGYYNNGKNIELSVGSNVPGASTINSYGDQVFFASGNLQATTSNNGSSWDWHFATEPWGYIGDSFYSNKRINGDGTTSTNGTVDLFGWVGESNTTWNGVLGSSGNAAMHGISNSQTNNPDYGSSATESLKSDWGNTINDGYAWRTLTSDEWVYLIQSRASGSTVDGKTKNPASQVITYITVNNARYSLAQINTTGSTWVNGMIIFPDGVTITEGEITQRGYINREIGNTTQDTWDEATRCTTAQWTALAAKGCTFIPMAGYRYKNAQETNPGVAAAGTGGLYWSSSPYDATKAYYMYISKSYIDPSYNKLSYAERRYGHSVRLVRDAN